MPMAQTAAEVLIDVLQDWGVDTVFGLPGDGISGIMEALRKKRDAIRFIQVRHEKSAAFMDGKKIVILAGRGTLNAVEELEPIADMSRSADLTPSARSCDPLAAALQVRYSAAVRRVSSRPWSASFFSAAIYRSATCGS